MSRRKNGKKVSQSNTIETKVATILESMNEIISGKNNSKKWVISSFVYGKVISVKIPKLCGPK